MVMVTVNDGKINKDSNAVGNEINSMICIQDRLGQINIHHQVHNDSQKIAISVPDGAICNNNDSSPETPQVPYNKQGWMEGIFGCLRPVLSIIGKANANEIKGNQDDWEIPFELITDLKWLGCGGQGIVFYGTLNNEPVAVKKVSDIKETDIRNLRKLNHPNIIKFKGVCTQPPCFCIVMEYCPYGPLYDLLRKQDKSVTPIRIVSWAKQIASGMQYLHSHKIIHRDLKSPNVLIGENEVIKISDFGTSRMWNEVSTKMSFAGTVAWMAPEAIQEQACSEKIDIWSFGVVLWELLTCETPYKDMEQSAIMYLVGCGKLNPPIPTTCPEGFKLIMQMCWKFNPKDRPSFKLICNHLEIASVEILSSYKDKQFFKTQESWKEEIKTQITHFKMNLQKRRQECYLKEEQLVKKRENELKHIRDIKELYDRKLERVNQMYLELSVVLLQLDQQKQECRKREMMQNKRRLIHPFMKKLEKRRGSQHSTTPTSPEYSLTSPDSPQTVQSKSPLYNTAVSSSSTVDPAAPIHGQNATRPFRKRHHRSNSGSPRTSGCSRSSSNRMSVLVDTETQTECMDISETDMSPSSNTTASTIPLSLSRSCQPQRVILREFKDGSDEGDAYNGNTVQICYLSEQDHQLSREFISITHSGTPCSEFLDEPNDDVNRNPHHKGIRDSDDDHLETIGRKVSEIITITNGNILTDTRSLENGNVSDNIDGVLKKRRCSETKELESAEDATNDSLTDEEGEDGQYDHSLRRRSLARRPIYPGRRSNRFKYINQYQREPNQSDEGNTSEYSNPPSSKSSTLESKPDTRTQSTKRPSERSDGSATDSDDSDENITVATEVCYEVGSKLESVV
ncbi:mitogen-activated protein kinase kinase kinase 13 isoform X2 [Agrilus planipennis]|uniref:Mitogen-activated protein kinase kinase kinase n=1 Tax=Agrilus planipennis TaxID=224129 RepID=A0A1W4WSB6_AGRPL|nr:mitogen-activated protein kinase kinase kinase 13 isoform X2 [Agrilus planipennis]